MSDKIIEEISGREILESLVDVVERTVKEDRRMVEFLLFTYVSAYTNDPGNLGIEAPTSEGKTYPAIEVSKLFPKEDVWLLGGLSPTSLVHDRGQLVDSGGAPIDTEACLKRAKAATTKEEREDILAQLKSKLAGGHMLVDLDGKILIFLEDPSIETWEKLRPILSHDACEISYKFADRSGKGQLKTTHVVIRGWPAAVYLRAGRGEESPIWDHIQSRFTTISPQMSGKKYRAAIEFVAMQKGLPSPVFERQIGVDNREHAKCIIQTVKERLLEIKKKAGLGANVFWIPFWKEIGKGFPAEIGRHMRDSRRFLTAMQMSAATNVFNRPVLEIDSRESIVVTPRDYNRAVSLYFGEEGAEEVLSGIPAHVIAFFKKVVLPCQDKKTGGAKTPEAGQQKLGEAEEESLAGICISEMVSEYKAVFGRTKSAKTLRSHYLPKLEDAGVITKEPDPSDKRRYLWKVLRREIIPEDWRKMMLFKDWLKKARSKNEPNFTLEILKERLEELEQIGSRNWRIFNSNYTIELSPDQLWDMYYPPRFDEPIYQGNERGDSPKKTDKNRPKVKMSQNEPKFDFTTLPALFRYAIPLGVGRKPAEPAVSDLKCRSVGKESTSVSLQHITEILARHTGAVVEKKRVAEEAGVPLEAVGRAISMFAERGKVIDRGGFVEVVR